MAKSPERERIANRYGFESYAELLDVSDELPVRPGSDAARTYIARSPGGHWFIWEDPTQPLLPSSAVDAEG